jgi:hypothetical protein
VVNGSLNVKASVAAVVLVVTAAVGAGAGYGYSRATLQADTNVGVSCPGDIKPYPPLGKLEPLNQGQKW